MLDPKQGLQGSIVDAGHVSSMGNPCIVKVAVYIDNPAHGVCGGEGVTGKSGRGGGEKEREREREKSSLIMLNLIYICLCVSVRVCKPWTCGLW